MAKAKSRKKAAISMIAVPTIIRAGDFSNLSGQVTVNGRPAGGIVVVFAVDGTLGAVIPGIAVTDSKGRFTAIFRSYEPGQAAFRAAAISAALPSFPGVSAASVVGIVAAAGGSAGGKATGSRK